MQSQEMQSGHHFASRKEDSSYIAILYLRVLTVITTKEEIVEGMVYKCEFYLEHIVLLLHVL